MLTFEATVSGGQVGSALADDPEECVEMLCELASGMSPGDLQGVQVYLTGLSLDNAAAVKKLLQDLLGALA